MARNISQRNAVLWLCFLCFSTMGSEVEATCLLDGDKGKEKDTRHQEKLQFFYSYTSFLILSFLIVLLWSVNSQRSEFSLAGCPAMQGVHQSSLQKVFSSSANKASSVLLSSLFLYLNPPLFSLIIFILGLQWLCIWDDIRCVALIKPGGGNGIFDCGLFFLIDCSEKVAGLGGDFCFRLTRNSRDQLEWKLYAVMWDHCRQQFHGKPKFSAEWVRKINPSIFILTCKGIRILRNISEI